MAGDINVYEGAANSGTEWDSLAGGLAAASSGDVIEISGAWTANDTSAGNAVSLANLTIRAVGSAKYVPGSTGHYVLELNSGTEHGINFSGTGTLTVEGFEIYVNTTTSSREGIRAATDGTLNVTDMHIWATGANSDQDGIYSYHAYAPTINITNSVIHGFARGAINYQIYSGGQNPGAVAINILSSTIYNANSGNDAQGGGIVADGGEINFDMDITIKVQDTLVHVSNGFAIGAGQNGTRHDGSAGNGTLTIDVDNCIVSDDMTPTPTGIDSFTNSLDNASFVETSTGTGTEVVITDLANSTFDPTLVDDADNDAQDYHSDAGLLLTLPSTDIVGTSRPQNSDYDLGAFEIVAGGGPVVHEASVSFGASLSSSPAGASELQAALALAQSQGISNVGGALLDAALILPASYGVGLNRSAVYEAAAAFANSQGLLPGNNAQFEAVQTLSTALGVNLDAVAVLGASVTLGIDAGFVTDGADATGPQTVEAALTVGVVHTMTQLTVANLFATASLGSQLALTTNGGRNVEAAIVYALTHSHAQTADISIEGALSLGVAQTVAGSANTNLEAGTVIAHQLGLQLIAGAIIEAGLDLSHIAYVNTSGAVLVVGVQTPDGRVITISAEDRVITIPNTDGNFTIN